MVNQNKNKKDFIRSELKETLSSLSSKRREEAMKNAYHDLITHLSSYKNILSFASMEHELSTDMLNRKLADEGRLVLPKTEGNSLQLYRVTDLDKELVPHSFYPLQEPNTKKALQISSKNIDCALIPGLGFDDKNYRIGYGKGYYDRLLEELEACMTIGLGFVEQRTTYKLSIDHHDHPVKKVFLY